MGTQPQNPHPPIAQPGKQRPAGDMGQPGGYAPNRDDVKRKKDKERYDDKFDKEDDYDDDEFKEE